MQRIYVGYDQREILDYHVAVESIRKRTSLAAADREIVPLDREKLAKEGHYTRTTSYPNGRMWDDVSAAPMSTSFAIARFFVPMLCGYRGWALFMDSDVLVRHDLGELFQEADSRYAVQCVHHDHNHGDATKKEGDVQLYYRRKNWSSVMLFNCEHRGARRLTETMLNEWPGRDLHGFDWLEEEEIGELSPRWNYLVGVSPPQEDPGIAHFTLGSPRIVDPGPIDEWLGLAWKKVVASSEIPV